MADKLKVTVLYDSWGEEEAAPAADAADSGRKRKVAWENAAPTSSLISPNPTRATTPKK